MINYSKKALKFLEQQPQNHALRIIKAINNIPNGDIKKLKGCGNSYRLRVGDFRVIYAKDDCSINVIDINNRGQIYKGR